MSKKICGFQSRKVAASATTPLADVAPGDTVKVVLHIDPAKTEFDQDDVSREVVVTTAAT